MTLTAQQQRAIKTTIVGAGLVALLGFAWNSKADTADVEAIGRDVRVIKALVCKDHPNDSLCSARVP